MKKTTKSKTSKGSKLARNRGYVKSGLLLSVMLLVSVPGAYLVNFGKAATHVKGDVNSATVEQRLLADPNVLWTGTADNSTWSPASWGMEGQGQPQNADWVAPPVPWRGKAVRLRHAGPGHPDTGDGRWGYDGRNTFANMGIPPQTEAYMRYYVYIPSNLAKQGKMPSLQGRLGTNIWGGELGHTSFGTRTMWKQVGTDPNKIGMITYLGVPWADGKPKPDGYDVSVRYMSNGTPMLFKKGAWNYVEQRVKLNTPGQKNGIFEGWINGVKGVSLFDVEYRYNSDLRISQWNLVTFWGGPPTDYPSEPTNFYYDDFVISRAPIGPRQDTVSPTPTASPDLVVTSVTTVPASPVTGEPMKFTATIKNQGTAATPAGTIHGVGFKINNSYVAWSDDSTASLAAGASRTLTSNGGPASGAGDGSWTTAAGTYSLEAHVDDASRITESDTANNKLTTSITVSSTPTPTPTPVPGTPDLVVTDISWSPSVPRPGDAVTFSATIKNQGTAATPSNTKHGVLFSVNGGSFRWSDTYMGPLNAGQSITLTANGGSGTNVAWTTSEGSFTVRAHVDNDNQTTESNENNNTMDKTMTVTQTNTAKPGDANGDGQINITDLNIVISSWGSTTNSQGDVNKDGRVDLADFNAVLANWGK